MKLFKKENGHTLIELIIVIAILAIVMVLMWTVYLSVNRSYIRADKKAQNLEDARVVMNQITDSFQSYKGCKVLVIDHNDSDQEKNLIDLVEIGPNETNPDIIDKAEAARRELYTVKEILIYDNYIEDKNDPNYGKPDTNGAVTITYGDSKPGELNWVKDAKNEVSQVAGFKANLNGDLLELKIELVNQGHGVVADQKLDVGTSLSLQYMYKGKDLPPVTP